jgi:hypothetical protein
LHLGWISVAHDILYVIHDNLVGVSRRFHGARDQKCARRLMAATRRVTRIWFGLPLSASRARSTVRLFQIKIFAANSRRLNRIVSQKTLFLWLARLLMSFEGAGVGLDAYLAKVFLNGSISHSHSLCDWRFLHP